MVNIQFGKRDLHIAEESKRESLVDDDLNGVILQFYFRMEKQVLACHVQICLEHTSQKQFVLGAEV